MQWQGIATGTRIWRTVIIVDVVLYFLLGVTRAIAASGGAIWLAVLVDLALLVTTALRVVVGHHWRTGPSSLASLGTAYFTLAIVSLVATVLSVVSTFMGESSFWGLLSLGVGVGMIFVALALQQRAAKAVNPVDATTLGTLRTYLIVLIVVGFICVAIPIMAIFVVLAYLAWLNRLTILLKGLADEYATRTTVVDTFD